ncbi:MAG: ribonuclease HII [Candidatus Margulisbacteria bacterium]|nr:ribonuclease HII [Candidatus Margulisiibacteriota bacterium]
MPPSLRYEKTLCKQGYKLIAGVDEVGRGPIAGPIVAAAVILPSNCSIKGLDDSKKLTPQKRESLSLKIGKEAVDIGIGIVDHQTIDLINIWQANLLAMRRAIRDLALAPDYLLIDGGRYKLDLPIPQRGITGGDGRCVSIAAASIIAKVVRDRLMDEYHKDYPLYRFNQHKGYGTKAHFQLLKKYGPCAIHRRSFFPCRQLFAG